MKSLLRKPNMNLEFPKLIIGNVIWGILRGRICVLYMALSSIPHTKKEEGKGGRNRRKREIIQKK